MTIRTILVFTLLSVLPLTAMGKPVIAIIGPGDMGDSLGPRFVELGYEVVYGSRGIGVGPLYLVR
jgi:hypothetical protein